MGAVGSLFLARIMNGEPIPFRDFLIMLSLMLASLFMLLAMDGLRIYWSHIFSIFAGVGVHRLMLLSHDASSQIPIQSRVAAVFIASTWLVGMVLIFTPRSNNFPLENASLFSALYGLIFLLPIMFSIVFIVIRKQFREFLLWITLLLGINLVIGVIHFNFQVINVMVWMSFLILVGCGLRLIVGENGFLKEI
jgi:hypothetical protein